MRKLFCGRCERTVVPLYEKEPGFEKRIVRGLAKLPTPDQRTVVKRTILADMTETEIQRLDLSHYNCDDCGNPIRPGEPCLALSMWREGGSPQPDWEGNFLDPRPKENTDGQDRPDASNAS